MYSFLNGLWTIDYIMLAFFLSQLDFIHITHSDMNMKLELEIFLGSTAHESSVLLRWKSWYVASGAYRGSIPGHIYYEWHLALVSQKVLAHLLSSVNTPTVQRVDVVFAAVHKATDEPVVAEDDGSHLCDVLIALVFSDVGPVIYQTWH